MTKSSVSGFPARTAIHELAAGDEFETDFGDLLANGQAVGRIGGMVVFVTGPLPGERARVRITLVKSTYAVGDLIELIDRSPDRATPFCDVFGICGGCQVQHLGYSAQLVWKRRLVRDALQRIGAVQDPQVAPTIGLDNPRAYRNKMSLVVEDVAGRRRFGFYQTRSHAVVPIVACPVVLPQLDSYIGDLESAAADPKSAPAFEGARHVIARAGRASAQAVLSVTTDRRSPALARAAPALAQHFKGLVGLGNSYEPASPNAVMGRKHATLAGTPEMNEDIDGVQFRVSPASFFQINSEMVGKIFAYLAPHVQTAPAIVDLYCGAGTFTLFFAKVGSRVMGIEENPHAVAEARQNAVLNGVQDRTTFVCGLVERVLNAGPGAGALRTADVVFLDPPRKGSDIATLNALAAAGVARIWYLSCNPATLARDVAQLAKCGYQLGVVQPFDMFPQTGHIEALAFLERSQE